MTDTTTTPWPEREADIRELLADLARRRGPDAVACAIALRDTLAELDRRPDPDTATCAVCGCTEDSPCEGGCSWTTLGLADLCTTCAEDLHQAVREDLAVRLQEAITRSAADHPHDLGAATHRSGLAQALRIVQQPADAGDTPPPLALRWSGTITRSTDGHTLLECHTPADCPTTLTLTPDERRAMASLLGTTAWDGTPCSTPGCGTPGLDPSDPQVWGWVQTRVAGTEDDTLRWYCSAWCAQDAIRTAAAELGAWCAEDPIRTAGAELAAADHRAATDPAETDDPFEAEARRRAAERGTGGGGAR